MNYQDNLENFIYEYYTYWHVQSMSDAQKVRLEKLVTKDGGEKASGKQKLWWRYLNSFPPNPRENTYEDRDGNPFWWRKDKSVDPNTGQFLAEGEIPVKTLLSDDDWASLYRYFRDNFRSMDRNRNGIDATFAKPYLDKWFGVGRMFGPAKPKYARDAINAIKGLDSLLNTGDRNANIAKLERLMEMGYRGKPSDLNEAFYQQLANPENGDAKFFSKMAEVFGVLDSNINTLASGQFANQKAAEFLNDLDSLAGPGQPGLSEIVERVQSGREEEIVEQYQISEMKLSYPELMYDLFDKEKRQEAFSAGGEPNLVSFINSAKSNNNFKDDQFNMIVPKYDDKRNWRESVKKYWDDYREGTWDKFGNRHRAHSYSSQSGQEWVEAILKCKIKPSDGIEKILAEKDKIKALFTGNNTAAIPQFNWGMTALKDLKDTGQMDKAFAGMFKDGRKMHFIVEHLIQKAARESKLEHCKSLMEMLYVMQYGPFASDVRDKLFGEKSSWTFIGDMPSFKGKPVMEFFGKTVDRVIKVGARVTFEGLNSLWRSFQRRGLSFGKNGREEFMDKMRDLFQTVVQDPDMTPADVQQALDTSRQDLVALQAARTTLANEEQTLTNDLALLTAQMTPQFQQILNLAEQRDNATNQKQQADAWVQNQTQNGFTAASITNALNQMYARMAAYRANPADPQFDGFDEEKLQKTIQQYEQMSNTYGQVATINQNFSNANNALAAADPNNIILPQAIQLQTNIEAKTADLDAKKEEVENNKESINLKHVEISTLEDALKYKEKTQRLMIRQKSFKSLLITGTF